MMLHQLRDTAQVQRRERDGSWSEVASVACHVADYRTTAYVPLGVQVAAGDVVTLRDAERFTILEVTEKGAAQRVRLQRLRQ